MGSQGDSYCGVLILLFLCDVINLLDSRYCEEGRASSLQEGNLGQSGTFPWLGVLKVHLHEGDSLKIAITGIVLIKDKYALGNANDIVRIPRDVFKADTKALFIPQNNEPWTSDVEDYITHPEYEYSSINTIAVVELKLGIDDFIQFKPICWPKYSYNTSNHLYVVGYTDENKLLEKEIHKLQFVKQKYCDEFYSRAGLKGNKLQPLHVQCAFSEHAAVDCVWETGQVMASNATGHWTMIGLGIRGPGCAAPARFISLYPYIVWIQTTTDLEQISDYRRSAFGTGFRKTTRPQKTIEKSSKIREVPIHDTFLREDNDEYKNATVDDATGENRTM
ncbi:unnamed protein product [Chilo suppressalis]|uniref:Peptidase S1 domain-containing protein n=1 Tax=Chilo suppressalis TaxID=168631 RepID=A0ABN8BBE5_CHISP|nr:unnamed protein product [Chilo suppressalis]